MAILTGSTALIRIPCGPTFVGEHLHHTGQARKPRSATLGDQSQDSRAPRASKVALGPQVISHRLPSGSAMNAERPPHDRSVASDTGVAPAATAATKAAST